MQWTPNRSLPDPPLPDPPLPAAVLAYGQRGEDWQAWVDALPAMRRDLLAEWELSLDGEAMYGECALVHRVVTRGGEPGVLKIGWPHWEADHEHLALRHWAGRGAVRLLRADPRRYAMLLEPADAGRDLNALGDLEACEAAARLYARLHILAPPRLRLLSEQTARWSAELLALPVSAPLPRRYVEQAAGLARDLAGDPGCDGRLIHTDLHYDNVLASWRAADRTEGPGGGADEEWLAIDPKPLSGDPHHEVAPLVWNRWEDLVATGDVHGAVRARFHTVVDNAGLDEQRARDWVIVREMVNAMWVLTDEVPIPGLADYVTHCVTITKAVQD